MEKEGLKTIVCVFTCKSFDRMIQEGGSASWVINSSRLKNISHIICARNDEPHYDEGDKGGRGEAHGSAFLVAEVRGVESVGADRYRILFGKYKRVAVDSFWDGSRNPVRYYTLSEINKMGIDVNAIDFEERSDFVCGNVSQISQPLSFEQAKIGLAKKYGVDVSNIKISIEC